MKGKVYSSAYRIKEAKLETKQKKLADVKQIALFYEQFHVYVSLITNFLHFFSKFQVFFITTITLFILFSFFFFSFFSFSFLVLFPFCNNFPLFSLPLLRGNFHLRLYNSSFFYSCYNCIVFIVSVQNLYLVLSRFFLLLLYPIAESFLSSSKFSYSA